jgi:hypothetical protein
VLFCRIFYCCTVCIAHAGWYGFQTPPYKMQRWKWSRLEQLELDHNHSRHAIKLPNVDVFWYSTCRAQAKLVDHRKRRFDVYDTDQRLPLVSFDETATVPAIPLYVTAIPARLTPGTATFRLKVCDLTVSISTWYAFRSTCCRNALAFIGIESVSRICLDFIHACACASRHLP